MVKASDSCRRRAGIGLRPAHLEKILARRPDLAWLEVHPENYMDDAEALAALRRIREHYPLSLHAVGLSLGSAGPLDGRHLEALRSLKDTLDPFLISDHLSWALIDGVHLNELLPLPYTEEALETVSRHVHEVQDALGRPILIENPSSYLRFRHSTLSEAAFLAELAQRTGCGVLFDLNNVYVSAHNVGVNPAEYFATLPSAAIGEFHLAGHSKNRIDGESVLIDDHGSRVCDEVWTLYAEAIRHFGERPTLIEWDSDLPALEVLLAEASRAEQIGAQARGDLDADAA